MKASAQDRHSLFLLLSLLFFFVLAPLREYGRIGTSESIDLTRKRLRLLGLSVGANAQTMR